MKDTGQHDVLKRFLKEPFFREIFISVLDKNMITMPELKKIYFVLHDHESPEIILNAFLAFCPSLTIDRSKKIQKREKDTGVIKKEKTTKERILKKISLPPGSVDFYVSISKYRILSHEEIVSIFQELERIKLKIEKDEINEERVVLEKEIARLSGRVVESNLRFVMKMANYYVKICRDPLVTFDDFFKHGTIGVLEAIKRYDYKMGVKFLSYARWWIRACMSNVLYGENSGHIIKLPVIIRRYIEKMNVVRNKFLNEFEREPEISELIEHSGLFFEQIDEARSFESFLHSDSIDAPVSSFKSTKIFLSEVPLKSILKNEKSEDPEEETLNRNFLLKLRLYIDACLSSREKEIVLRHSGFLGDEETLQEIGDSLGLSRERIRVIFKESIEKIKEFFNRNERKAAEFCSENKAVKVYEEAKEKLCFKNDNEDVESLNKVKKKPKKAFKDKDCKPKESRQLTIQDMFKRIEDQEDKLEKISEFNKFIEEIKYKLWEFMGWIRLGDVEEIKKKAEMAKSEDIKKAINYIIINLREKYNLSKDLNVENICRNFWRVYHKKQRIIQDRFLILLRVALFMRYEKIEEISRVSVDAIKLRLGQRGYK